MNTVTRSELTDAVQRILPAEGRARAGALVDQVLEEITDALARGDAVRLRGFANFTPHSKNARVGRNPKNGVAAVITARRVVRFKASPTLCRVVSGEPA